jgi:hypothetical protein
MSTELAADVSKISFYILDLPAENLNSTQRGQQSYIKQWKNSLTHRTRAKSPNSPNM